MGKSVIDYAICSADFLQHIKNLNIPSKVFFDHMPLTLDIVAYCHISKVLTLPKKLC